jgi:hypothetical protein
MTLKYNKGKNCCLSSVDGVPSSHFHPERVSAETRSNHYSTRVESVNERRCKNMQTHAKLSLLFPYTNFVLLLLSFRFKLIKKEWEAGRISSGD